MKLGTSAYLNGLAREAFYTVHTAKAYTVFSQNHKQRKKRLPTLCAIPFKVLHVPIYNTELSLEH